MFLTKKRTTGQPPRCEEFALVGSFSVCHGVSQEGFKTAHSRWPVVAQNERGPSSPTVAPEPLGIDVDCEVIAQDACGQRPQAASGNTGVAAGIRADQDRENA